MVQEFIYFGAGHPQAGQIKETKVLPDPVPAEPAPLTQLEVVNIKLNAIATKLGVDLEAAVAAATNG